MQDCQISPAQTVTDDGLALGPSGIQVQLSMQPFNKQELCIRVQPNAVEIVGIHQESSGFTCTTLTLSKKYHLARLINENALVAEMSPSSILTLAAPWA